MARTLWPLTVVGHFRFTLPGRGSWPEPAHAVGLLGLRRCCHSVPSSRTLTRVVQVSQTPVSGGTGGRISASCGWTQLPWTPRW
jgi:hypothetical protein